VGKVQVKESSLQCTEFFLMTRVYCLPKSDQTTFNVCIVKCNYLDPNAQQERSMSSLPEKRRNYIFSLKLKKFQIHSTSTLQFFAPDLRKR